MRNKVDFFPLMKLYKNKKSLKCILMHGPTIGSRDMDKESNQKGPGYLSPEQIAALEYYVYKLI